MPPIVPDEYLTSRLLLRRWQVEDATRLAPILAANVAHLGPWIPRRVAEPAGVDQLAERLSAFSAAFDAGREWRYALSALQSGELLGEVGLFPRTDSGRVQFEDADQIEVGYWLRVDVTGQGFATEAVTAAVALASKLPRVTRLTMHCDERNAPSIAVPRRLGFQLAMMIVGTGVVPGEAPVRLQIWERLAEPSR